MAGLTSEQVTQKVKDLLKKDSEKETTEVPAEAKAETKEVEVKDTPTPTASEEADKTKSEEAKKPEETKAEPEKKETATPAETDTSSEKKDFNNPVPPTQKEQDEKKHSYSPEEKREYAFKREVSKRKAAEEKARKLQKELEDLRKNKPADNADLQTQVNYQVDLKDKERELEHQREYIDESQRAEYEELNERRIQQCFAAPKDQEEFRRAVKTEGPKLLKKLDQSDPENAVLSYLDDSDLSPILMRVLMAKENILENILSKRSPYGKYQAMAELEGQVREAQRQLSEKSKAVPQETQQPSPEPKKPALPVVGSVTKSDSTKDSKRVFDPNELLRKLKGSSMRYHQ